MFLPVGLLVDGELHDRHFALFALNSARLHESRWHGLKMQIALSEMTASPTFVANPAPDLPNEVSVDVVTGPPKNPPFEPKPEPFCVGEKGDGELEPNPDCLAGLTFSKKKNEGKLMNRKT